MLAPSEGPLVLRLLYWGKLWASINWRFIMVGLLVSIAPRQGLVVSYLNSQLINLHVPKNLGLLVIWSPG